MSTLKQNYQTIKDKINSLPSEHKVQLIAVSKTFPSKDIRELFSYGQTAFAENYVQEFVAKAEELKDLAIEWHYIGKIQSNKTKHIAKYANWIHGLESAKHAIRLNNDRPANMPKLNVLIEVNLSGDITRHGLNSLDEILGLVSIIKQQENLIFRGLMGVASATSDSTIVKLQFERLNALFKRLQLHNPTVDTLSMGMSGDYALAIECGSSMVRIGSLIFGNRSYNSL